MKMKKKNLRKLTALLLIGVMAISALGCGKNGEQTTGANGGVGGGDNGRNGNKTVTSKSSDEKITLNVINYHVGTDYAADYYAYLFDSFTKTAAGQNVVFNFEEIPTTDAFNQKIKLLISSGTLPDIVLNGGNNITELAARSGKVADLTPYFDNDPEWKELFDQRSLEFNTVDGRIYGVPVSKEISYIYYNKELFEKAGVAAPETAFDNWGDFFAACEKFKAAGITPVGMDTADSGWLSNLWFSALIATQNAHGHKWMNTEYPTDFNTPELIAAAGTLQKMLAEYTTADAVGGKYDPMATHFFNGEVAMFPNGPWMIPDFRSPDKAAVDFYDKVGVMLMPHSGMSMVPTPGDMVGASDPAKIEAAVAFLKYATTIENQLKALEMTGLQPVSPQVEIPATLSKTDPLMARVLDVAGKAQITYGQNQAYWHQNVIDAFSTYLPELAYYNITAEQFCTKLTEAALKN
jgi:raffinose/stachyose/melibiose transport system substrate-binding protein